MLKINKRGQIDKVITTIPVMILVFVILGIFLFLSFSVKNLSAVNIPDVAVNNAGNNNLLLNTVEFTDNAETQRVSLFDLIVKTERKEISRSEIEKTLKEISKMDGKCAILIKAHYEKTLTGKDYLYNDYAFFAKNGEIISSSYDGEFERQLVSNYREKGLLAFQPYYINGIDGIAGQDMHAAHYYGECLK